MKNHVFLSDMKTMTKSSPIIDAPRQVVADCYAILGQTHLCHWNVRGPGFFTLHNAFEVQYTELFAATDEIAERIRALGALAPGGLASLAKLSGISELEEDASAERMVVHLIEANEKLLADLRTARDVSAKYEDPETEDLMISRVQHHEKTIWMLKSYLSGD